MSETFIQANGVKLCTETFGNPEHPHLLLIMGACASMIWWPDELCRRLADSGFHVIRFDHRDTGRSICYGPGRIGYTLDDMAADALGVLDAYGARTAHLVGASLGGMIGQILAITVPERVESLTLIMSSAVGRGHLHLPWPELPRIDPKVLDYHTSSAALNWENDEAVVEYLVGGWRVTAGSGRPFDEDGVTTMARREVARAKDLMSMFNHTQLTGGESYDGQLGRIRARTLIAHGTEDPVLPYPHALALQRAIPGAQLLELKGAGHEIHPQDWNVILERITRL